MWSNERLGGARHDLRERLRRLGARYGMAVESWIALTDKAYSGGKWMGGNIGRTLGRAAFENPLLEPESKSLVRLTLGLLLLVFTWILVSCQTPGPIPQAPRRETRVKEASVEKRPDTLYLKRETIRVKPRDRGSSTGSIWADTETPRHLLADEKPVRQGEMVSIVIPDELQFQPPAQEGTAGASGSKGTSGSSAPGRGSKASKAGPESGEAAATAKTGRGDPKLDKGNGGSPSSDALAAGLFTDPSAVGILGDLRPGPVKNFKMQIVGIEPTGEVYLRGVKTYQNNLGERRDVTVFAKLPSRQLNSFEVDARDLSEISLTEQVNGQSSDYASTGWDTVVSRKLAGFSPDIDAELQALEDVRNDLGVAQESVKDQMRAMGEERERMQKERKRAFEENERLKQALLQEREGPKDGGQDGGAGKAGGEATPSPGGSLPTDAAAKAMAPSAAAGTPSVSGDTKEGAPAAPGPK